MLKTISWKDAQHPEKILWEYAQYLNILMESYSTSGEDIMGLCSIFEQSYGKMLNIHGTYYETVLNI
jgi:hypothetical protein